MGQGGGWCNPPARLIPTGISEPSFAGQFPSVDRAVELDPKSPEVRKALGIIYYWVEGDYERALTEATHVASRLPNDSELFDFMTAILRRQGRGW